jgi:hypothetical protein
VGAGRRGARGAPAFVDLVAGHEAAISVQAERRPESNRMVDQPNRGASHPHGRHEQDAYAPAPGATEGAAAFPVPPWARYEAPLAGRARRGIAPLLLGGAALVALSVAALHVRGLLAAGRVSASALGGDPTGSEAAGRRVAQPESHVQPASPAAAPSSPPELLDGRADAASAAPPASAGAQRSAREGFAPEGRKRAEAMERARPQAPKAMPAPRATERTDRSSGSSVALSESDFVTPSPAPPAHGAALPNPSHVPENPYQ